MSKKRNREIKKKGKCELWEAMKQNLKPTKFPFHNESLLGTALVHSNYRLRQAKTQCVTNTNTNTTEIASANSSLIASFANCARYTDAVLFDVLSVMIQTAEKTTFLLKRLDYRRDTSLPNILSLLKCKSHRFSCFCSCSFWLAE